MSAFAFRLFFLVSCCLIFNLESGAQDRTVEAVKRIESLFSRMVEKNDLKGLRSILHPNFTSQSPDGFFTSKDSILARYSKGGNKYVKSTLIADTLVVITPDMIVISGREEYTQRAADSNLVTAIRFYYHVWIYYNHKWTLASRLIAAIPVKK